MDSAPSARAWLETELGNLLAAVVVMTEEGWPGQAARLAAAIGPYLESAGRAPEAVTVHRRVMRAARLADDGAGEAAALGNLAVIDRRLGRYPQAAEHHQQAAALFRHGWARAHHGLARAYQAVGSPDQARGHFGAALNLYSQLGAPQAEQIRVQLAALDSNPAVP